MKKSRSDTIAKLVKNIDLECYMVHVLYEQSHGQVQQSIGGAVGRKMFDDKCECYGCKIKKMVSELEKLV